ncbi:tumor necrosis factor receptor superfamily member 6-like [Thamnophis elegans]|uniref:tumor necrosis factor receptor superfamily member 6-like n=1 Tax=Thamnophis elegans TaxID=35005 RepID=UPI001376F462|nr:tumor necrosis factor receptor superfamily member 6-like [Thamnophis elegans]
MSQLLLFLVLCPILDLTTGRSLNNNPSVLAVQLQQTKQNCSSEQYDTNGICCPLCKPGSVVKSPDCTRNPKANCKPCTEGEDYMDSDNYITKCRRCSLCDTVHGMETETNCTITQNVKCRCRIGFFCNSTKPCRHCEKCDECKSGIIAKECTRTQNTVCGEKQDNTTGDLWWLCLILPFVALIVGSILYWYYRARCRGQMRLNIPNQNGHNHESHVQMIIKYPDINLKPFIPEIVCDMEVNQVKRLVRKLGISTPQIDGIIYDNLYDSSEQKIKLLEHWHQTHGLKGSCQTLITSLRVLKFNDAADKVNQIIEGACSHPED